MTKTFQHLKQWQPTSIVSALSLESVRIVGRNKVHKTPKAAVAFEPCFCSQSVMGTPLFPGNLFEWARFCNESGPLVFQCLRKCMQNFKSIKKQKEIVIIMTN